MVKHGCLSLEPEDRPVGVGLVEQHAGVVHQVPRREVVGPVGDHVVGSEYLQRVFARQEGLVQFDLYTWVDRGDLGLGRFEFGSSHIRFAMNHLPLQVREINDVEIHDAEAADPRCGEIQRGWRAQPPSPDEQHTCALELALPRKPDFRQNQMARVAQDFVRGKVRKVVHSYFELRLRCQVVGVAASSESTLRQPGDQLLKNSWAAPP
ncbi:MAG: hypothetical protein CNCCGFBP_01613 [Fimbriimonadaceae bacterium]|nr:hypothetical protein [Fimbriimonadaceae bacterium]